MPGHQSPFRRRAMYAPRPLRAAYGIQPLLDRGINGRGVTVVLLEAVTGAGQRYIVHPAGGTAAAAAIWAGLIAVADQDAGRALGLVNPVIYRIGRSPSYRAAFHSVTAGTNTVHSGKETITGYQAASGWNPVTGWGSPNAQVLIPLLVRSS